MCRELLFKTLCDSKKFQRSSKYGFTLVELLIVLACIFFILAVFLPALSYRPENPYRTVCANNVRDILLGLLLYANDNDNNLPLQPDTYSLNEISKETSDTLLQYLGVDLKEFRAHYQGDMPVQSIFFCPDNPSQLRYRETLWNASVNHRAIGYFFIIDSKEGRENIKGSGDKIWLKSLNAEKPSKREMVTDSLTCDDVNYKPPQFPKGNFAKCPFKISIGEIFISSSHLKDDKKPYGGNIGFADGHVEWRPFKEMEKRFGQNPVCWW